MGQNGNIFELVEQLQSQVLHLSDELRAESAIDAERLDGQHRSLEQKVYEIGRAIQRMAQGPRNVMPGPLAGAAAGQISFTCPHCGKSGEAVLVPMP